MRRYYIITLSISVALSSLIAWRCKILSHTLSQYGCQLCVEADTGRRVYMIVATWRPTFYFALNGVMASDKNDIRRRIDGIIKRSKQKHAP